jgi:hypothetical protein
MSRRPKTYVSKNARGHRVRPKQSTVPAFMVFQHAEKKDTTEASVTQLGWPFRMLMAGPVSCGKRNLTLNVVSNVVPKPERVIVIHMDSDSREYDGVATEIHGPGSDFSFASLAKCDGSGSGSGSGEKKAMPRTLVVIDELDLARMKQSERQPLLDLLRYGSSHRSTSVIICFQLFSRASLDVRRLISAVTIWPGLDYREYTLLAVQYGLDVTELRELLSMCGPREPLTIDLSVSASHPLRYRMCWYWPISRKVKSVVTAAPPAQKIGAGIVTIQPPADVAEPARDLPDDLEGQDDGDRLPP